MKKAIVLFVIILLVLGGLFFLYYNNDESEKTTIRFAWWGGDDRHKATLAVIEKYTKQNPNIKIQPEYMGAERYLDKIKIQLSSQTAPDIMQIDQTWIEELISKKDYFLDLSNQKSIDTKTFDQDFLKKFCIYNNKLLGLPTGLNAQIMLVNQTAAEKMGVDTKKITDWDDLLLEGQKLHAKNPDYYLLSHDTYSFMGEVLLGMVKQRTGKPIFDKNNKLALKSSELEVAFDWLFKAKNEGLIQPAGEASLYSLKAEQNPKWISQQIISIIDWTSNYSRYLTSKESKYIAMLPPISQNAKDGSSTVRPSQEICINAKSKNKEAATKFLNWFLNDKEASLILGDVRSIPASKIARDTATNAKKIDKMTSEIVNEALKKPKSVDTALAYNRQIVDTWNDIALAVEFNKMSPSKAAEEFINRINNKITEIN